MIHSTQSRLRPLLVAALLATAATATAQTTDQERRVDGYTVRWSATVTGFLPQSVVEKHQLKPSGRGILNVVVLDRMEGDEPPPTVRADVSVTATNLAEQLRTINMYPVTDDGRTSYIGTFDVHHGDVLDFNIRVRPPDREEPFTVNFERRFFLRGGAAP